MRHLHSDAVTFTANLGAKNGVSAATYVFRKTASSTKSGSYSGVMVSECKKYGMKPVCDNPVYCKNDTAALYIGQTGNLAYPLHRNNNNYVPSGFAAVRDKWKGLCSYTAKARGNYARCNTGSWRVAWRRPNKNTGFICGVRWTGGRSCMPTQRCSACEGHCISDADCADEHLCFQRKAGSKAAVPGCGTGGAGDVAGRNFCFHPQANPQPGWTCATGPPKHPVSSNVHPRRLNHSR